MQPSVWVGDIYSDIALIGHLRLLAFRHLEELEPKAAVILHNAALHLERRYYGRPHLFLLAPISQVSSIPEDGL